MPAVPNKPRQPARRFEDKPSLDPSAIWALPEGHAALKESRTLFPSTVVTVDEGFDGRLLVSGKNNRKLGDKITKGKFKGYALYCLSLEERATCPTDCAALRICYGNSMQMARRHRIDDLDYFFTLIADEIREILQVEDGLMIRLHVLGDFPSVEYVEWWHGLLERHPNLAVFGYTHRRRKNKGGDAIGDAIEGAKLAEPERFRIRWSSEKNVPDGAIIIDEIPAGPKFNGALVCPAQRDATACCASCGLCWEAASQKETIAFVKHGKKSLTAAAESAMAASVVPAAPSDFGTLLTAQIPRLTKFARSLTRDSVRADDLVQDTLVRAIKCRDQFEDGTNLAAWLTMIARNLFLSERRKDGREIEDPEGFIIGQAVSQDSQAEVYEANESLEEFERLPPDYREAMRLIADGDSYEEAAQKLGIKLGTVKSRVSRGRTALISATGDDAIASRGATLLPIRAVMSLATSAKVHGRPQEVDAPTFRMVSPGDLKIESTYQRDLSAKSIKLIRKIVSEFDWAKFKPPVCAQTKEGLFVIDGQHTAIAAATHPGINTIPVLIVSADKIARRAAAFVSHNRDRLVMTKAQIFYGDLAAEDKGARAVMECIFKSGASVPRLPVAKGQWRPGQVSAVGELRAAHKGAGAAVLERMLRIAVASKVAPISNTLLRALRVLLVNDAYRAARLKPDAAIVAAIVSLGDIPAVSEQYAAQMEVSRFVACADLILAALK